MKAPPVPAAPQYPRRRSRRAEAAILESTLVLLGECGFSGLTVDGIAARAGVGKATIYRHWASKAELVVEVFKAFVPPLPEPDTGSLREDLLTVLSFMVDGLSRSPLARILPSMVEAAEHDPELERLFRDFGAGRRRVLRDVLERAAARGELRPGLDLDVALDVLVGPIFARRLIVRKPLTRRFAEQIVEMVLPALQQSPRSNSRE